MLAHPSGSAFAESALRNAFAFRRRIYRFGHAGAHAYAPCGFDLRRMFPPKQSFFGAFRDLTVGGDWCGDSSKLTPPMSKIIRRFRDIATGARPPAAEVIEHPAHGSRRVTQDRRIIANLRDGVLTMTK